MTSEIRGRSLCKRTTRFNVERQNQTILALRRERLRTALGELLLLTDEAERLRALDWEDCEPRMQRLLHLHYGACGTQITERPAQRPSRTFGALSAYFAGELSALREVPVETGGTAFQRAVWAFLRRIEVGKTVSYAEVASGIGQPKAARAVGLANGKNPVGIVVPCHRVIGSSAALIGYAGGIERKRWLLSHEGALLSRPVRSPRRKHEA